jgi:hypothetical protein
MIRRATMQDLDAMSELGRRVHSASADRDVPLVEVNAKLKVAGIMASKKGFVLVDENAGQITGMLIGFSDEMFFSRSEYAIALLTYAERPGAFVWMLKRFLKWALESRKVAQVVLDCSFGGELGKKAEKLYDRLGFERAGSTFIIRGQHV